MSLTKPMLDYLCKHDLHPLKKEVYHKHVHVPNCLPRTEYTIVCRHCGKRIDDDMDKDAKKLSEIILDYLCKHNTHLFKHEVASREIQTVNGPGRYECIITCRNCNKLLHDDMTHRRSPKQDYYPEKKK